MKLRFPSRCGMALVSAVVLSTTHVQAQPTIYSDPMGDISTNVGTGAGTLDIIKMEVSDSVSDVIFNLTVNGNITSTDWGKFMIGIANMKAAGTTNVTGNGWARPINMVAGATNGMTHWIGSWIDGGGGAQLWTYSGSNWTGPTAPASYTFLVNTNGTSTITYIVAKASLGVTNGDTIYFDAYSSGGEGTDSAVDALSNPNIAITGWSGPYTSDAITGISIYTLSNSAVFETQEITFSVDMNTQIAIGEFYPQYNDEVYVEWGPDPDNDGTRAYLLDEDDDGIYTGTAEVSAPLGTPVSYRFGIELEDKDWPPKPESVSRSFSMPDESLVLGTVFFNNLEGRRNVTFTVDMSVQEDMGAFDPNTQDVKVVGSFNGWNTGGANTPLVDQGDGIYSRTILVDKITGTNPQYKFYKTGLGDAGYESIADRTAEVVLNEDGDPDPAQILPTVFFNDLDSVPTARNVTFTVDMGVQVNHGLFTPGDPVSVRGDFNAWGATALTREGESNIYSATIRVDGENGSTIDYKFYQPTGSKWEGIANRSFILSLNEDGELNPPQELPAVYWDNDSGQTRDVTFSVDMGVQVTLGNFPAEGGTVSVVGSFNGWNSGSGVLTNDGNNVFSGTFSISGEQGSSSEYKFHSTNIGAGDNAYETINNRILVLGAPDEAQVVPTVYWNDNAGGTTFATWSGGQEPTSALVAQYAVGGASSPTADDGIPSVSSLSENVLSLVAIVRTDDPNLAVTGITTTNLAEGPWTNAGVSVIDAPDQTGVPSGCTRKIFSVAQDGTRRFLTISATLTP